MQTHSPLGDVCSFLLTYSCTVLLGNGQKRSWEDRAIQTTLRIKTQTPDQ